MTWEQILVLRESSYWIISSLLLSTLNKTLLSNTAFTAFGLTSSHLLLCSIYCFIRNGGRLPHHSFHSGTLLMSASHLLSITAGNFALSHLSIAVAKMVAAMAPITTVCLKHIVYSSSTFGSSRAISSPQSPLPFILASAGTALALIGEVRASKIGIAASLLSLVFRSWKSIMQESLMKRHQLQPNDLFYTCSLQSLVMSMFLMPFSYTNNFTTQGVWSSSTTSFSVWLLLVASGLVAITYNHLTIKVTSKTSAEYLRLLGNVTVCFHLLLSYLLQDSASAMVLVGACCTLLSLYLATSSTKSISNWIDWAWYMDRSLSYIYNIRYIRILYKTKNI